MRAKALALESLCVCVVVASQGFVSSDEPNHHHHQCALQSVSSFYMLLLLTSSQRDNLAQTRECAPRCDGSISRVESRATSGGKRHKLELPSIIPRTHSLSTLTVAVGMLLDPSHSQLTWLTSNLCVCLFVCVCNLRHKLLL